MAENMYVSEYGVTRVFGRGEGYDELCDSTAHPSMTANNVIEVIVDENGPVENAGSEFGRGAAKIPAGCVVVKGTLLVQKAGSAADVTLNLVDKDGSNSVALLAATTPSGDNTVVVCEGAAIGSRTSVAKYVKAGGTRTGLKAVLLLEYI